MKFFLFELKYWLRQPMVYVFFLINTLIIYGATYSDQITVGGSFGNIHKNAPFVIMTYYSVMSFITLLMTTSFILASTIRDFTYNTWQILFTTPLKRAQYLIGRFAGAVVIAIIPLLGVSLGIILGCAMPDMDAEKIGAFIPSAHLMGIATIAIPNTLFSASFVFMIAALSRNTISAYIGSILLLLLTGIAGAFAEDLSKEWIATLIDPFGASTFSILTKYWTVNQKNTEVLELSGLFLTNRIIWILISCSLALITVRLFSFTEKSQRKKSKSVDSSSEEENSFILHHNPLPVVKSSFNPKSYRIMLLMRVRYELKGILKSPAFIILMLAGLMNFIPNIIAEQGQYGLTSYPVTYGMIDMIQGLFYSFLIAIIIIYSGLLIWRERESHIDEIYDATPHPTWVTYLSKFFSMAVILLVIHTVVISFSILVQLAKGFTDIRFDVYVKSILLIDYPGQLFLVAMAMIIHALVNNKYLAFFLFIIFLIANNFTWVLLEVESNMVRYGAKPGYTYSDMNGFGPYSSGMAWFRFYWGLIAILITIVSVLAWPRGKESTFKSKMANVREGIRRGHGRIVFPLIVVWLFTAAFVFYNTQLLNEYDTSEQQDKKQADYEKQFQKYRGLPQPRIVDVHYNIELFPKERKAAIKTEWWVKNKSDVSIDSIHFTLPVFFKTRIQIPGSKLVADHNELRYLIYKLDRAMQPGDSLKITISSDYRARGFENEVAFSSIVDNGSFFNNFDFTPQIGYQPDRQLQDRDKRKKYDLGEVERMPKLERNCSAKCMNNYLGNHSDWVRVETVFSTDGDQVAVAPGSLRKQWTQNGRNYYMYALDHPSQNFYSFISARYQVLRSKHKGVDVEVYYDSKHKYNIENMERSMKRSLDYYIDQFGPYYHHQVRIIEFPRYETFAQAFPGTMPYSEGIGFIAKIEDEEDIDMVFYVVAHEMAHQYWAHQIIGAEMQGATLLSETFAQYSALMVMEKEYGRDAMKKFLEYEMDEDLRSRGTERLKELPLMFVENQGYIHYRKGSLIMYYLKEMIGEENVNKALRKLLTDFAYKEPPYPTAHHAVDAFREVTPDSLQYIIRDLFENITIYNNRVLEAKARESAGGKYELTLHVRTQKFIADSLGRETEIPVNDWIEIGAFAEPEEGKSIGAVLYRKKHHITKPEQTITLLLDSKPAKAGIDPMNLMVDMVGEDNLKEVDLE